MTVLSRDDLNEHKRALVSLLDGAKGYFRCGDLEGAFFLATVAAQVGRKIGERADPKDRLHADQANTLVKLLSIEFGRSSLAEARQSLLKRDRSSATELAQSALKHFKRAGDMLSAIRVTHFVRANKLTDDPASYNAFQVV